MNREHPLARQTLDQKASLAFNYLFPVKKTKQEQELLELVEQFEQEQQLIINTRR